jgi:hypothetical protein
LDKLHGESASTQVTPEVLPKQRLYLLLDLGGEMRRPVEPIKKRRRKTAALTRHIAPKTTSRHISSASIEMELRTSEERWRSLLDNPIFGVTFLDEHQRFVTTSRTFQNMVG